MYHWEKNSPGIIEFDWQPSWILTDLLKRKLFLKYFIKIHQPNTYAFRHFCSQRLGNGLWESMSAKNSTVDIVICYEES